MAQGTIKKVDLDYSSDTLTTTQNLSNPGILMERYGRIGRITFSSGTATTGASGWTDIGTLPVKYRPNRRALGILIDDSTVSPVEAAIETSGTLRIWGMISGHSYWGSFLYII